MTYVMKLSLFLCNNTNDISLSKYNVHHSRAKYIFIKHHFIRDHIEIGKVLLKFVDFENQLEDIFTNPLHEERFCFLFYKLKSIYVNYMAYIFLIWYTNYLH